MADYNAKVMSLLGTDTIPEGTINRSNIYEQLYTVSGRQIICPSEPLNSVSTDSYCETLKFRIPRFWDGNDLAQHTGKILFINAAGESDEQQILEAEVTDTSISFDWCLCSRVTKAAGAVNFALRFETIDTETEEIAFRWTTLPCSLTIAAGLNWTAGEIEATYPTVLEQWLQEMTDIKAQVNDMMLNIGGQTAGAQEATDAANKAAENANTATANATDAAALANSATTNANNAADAANAAAANANTVVTNANTSINETKDAAIENIVAAKDATITATNTATEAATNANNAANTANTAADNANAAKEAAEAATTDLTKVKEDVLLATTKANNAAEYALTYASEISSLQVGDEFKKNQIWRVAEAYANAQNIRAGLYICRANYVYTDTTKTFVDLLNNYVFTFMMDEGKGDKGDKGDNGYSPVVGVDYYTEAEKTEMTAEIVNKVYTEIGLQLDEINGEEPLDGYVIDTTAEGYEGTAWNIDIITDRMTGEDSVSITGSNSAMSYQVGSTFTLSQKVFIDGAEVNLKGALIESVDTERGLIVLTLNGETYNVFAIVTDYRE